MDGPTEIVIPATQVLWVFFPGFAALSIPWPLTIWILRRMGREDEVDAIEEQSNERGGGIDSYRVLKWFSFWVALPIGLFTLPAIPIHLSIAGSRVFVGHYGRWKTEVFELDQATSATFVSHQTATKGGGKRVNQTLLIDFRDGLELDANAAGDGGTSANPAVVRMLLERTGLTPQLKTVP